MPQALPAPPPATWLLQSDTTSSPVVFAAALVIAGLLHAVLLFAVRFDVADRTAEQRTTRPLEIIVLREAAPTDKVPDKPDAFAQVDREGGGTEQQRNGADGGIPEPPAEPPRQPPPQAIVEIEAPQPSPEPVFDRDLPAESVEEPVLSASIETEKPETAAPPPEREIAPRAEVAQQPPVTAAQILASRNREIADLASRIAEHTTTYANRPRRRAISTSTREYKYAAYLEAWRRKVERIGNLNYPEEAKKHKLYGNLILSVAVRADGGLDSVRVLRSSGFDILDEAAVNIVKLAAPFAPFPPDIQSETDVLDITRTWQFLSSNRLVWGN